MFVLLRAALFGLGLYTGMVQAASLSVQVTDAAGQPLVDTVVYAESAGSQPAARHQKTEIEQRGRKFAPLVTVVQTGAEISFPNNDTVRHHVYSFSSAKTFDIKLYSGTPGTPILFDKAGTVIIGCNIHDQMVAYIQIVSTPYFGKTDAAGRVKLDGLAPGKYQLKAWHYVMSPGTAVPEQALTVGATDATAAFKLAIKVPAAGSAAAY
jgi:plastocyanin